ncbi:MAG: NOB1 family endonuclease [Candidatus Hodarchaeales archaeon]
MNNIKRETFILDSTAFIRLDFPRIQTIEESTFLTTYSVREELKDFRSRMNLDTMLHSNRLTLISPDPNNIKAMTERLKRVDPIRKLSLTDIEILTLTLEENGVLITNDFAIQNAAHQFKIKTQVVSGKKIKYTRKGILKCTSCNKKFKLQTDSCPDCGGKLKQVYTTKKINM